MNGRSIFGTLRAMRALSLTASMLILSGCATLTALGETETDRAYCDAFRPISWSARDTDQTIREVKAHNATGRDICAWQVPPEE